MQAHSRRIFPRNQYEAPIQYLYLQPDRYYNSRMYNFSQGGLYFEPFQPLELSSQINIIMPNYSPDTNGPEAFQSYLAVIRWCQKLSDEKSSRFGVGVEDVFGLEIEELMELGLVTWGGKNEERLLLTQKAYFLGNQVFMRFV